jgi:hypothetical protein
MGRARDPFRIPRAGIEMAPAAGLAALDVNFNGGHFSNGEFLAESTLGGMAVYACYQAQGDITRAVQVQMIASTVWESVKHGAAVSMILAVVLLVCPWLSLPLSVLGLVGMGKASLDLFHAFWDALDELQRAELLAAAMEAGVNLRTYLRGGDGAWA